MVTSRNRHTPLKSEEPVKSDTPHTPTDQAWIETLFGHVKGEWPHLERITDPPLLERERERERVRVEYNTVRLHAGIGYVTPGDEHAGRGDAIREARRRGLEWPHLERLAYHRSAAQHTEEISL